MTLPPGSVVAGRIFPAPLREELAAPEEGLSLAERF
jgi:hypothetical protein